MNRESLWASFARENGIDDGQLRREIHEAAHPARGRSRLSADDARERLSEMIDVEALDDDLREQAIAEGHVPGTQTIRVLAEDAQMLRASGYLVG